MSRCEKAYTTDTDFCWRIYVTNSKSIPLNLLSIKTCPNICLQARTASAFCRAVFLSQYALTSLFSHPKQAVGNESWPNCERWLNNIKMWFFFQQGKTVSENHNVIRICPGQREERASISHYGWNTQKWYSTEPSLLHMQCPLALPNAFF